MTLLSEMPSPLPGCVERQRTHDECVRVPEVTDPRVSDCIRHPLRGCFGPAD